MEPNEYANLAEVETRHWFYVGKRQIVRHWIQRVHPLQADHLLADCGAGTGTFAAEMASCCQVLALDDHEESLTLARNKIDSIQESPVSLMPENLLKDLRPAEVRDLFGYLQSDKRPSSP